jgi:uncharacterized protein YndB with AHSA1/START domain
MSTNQNAPKVQNRSEYGIVEQISGRWVLRFERRLPHSREKVWNAITRPERIGEWFSEGDVELDLVDGGKFEIRTTGPPQLVKAIIDEVGEQGLVQHNTVVHVDPPSVFEHTFGDPNSLVRWTLTPDGDGTLVRLVHTVPPEFDMSDEGPRTLAGWHELLDRLAQVLDGKPGDWGLESWEARRDEYAARVATS